MGRMAAVGAFSSKQCFRDIAVDRKGLLSDEFSCTVQYSNRNQTSELEAPYNNHGCLSCAQFTKATKKSPGFKSSGKYGMIVYGYCFKNLPVYIGNNHQFGQIHPYVVVAFQAGRNLYPYIWFMPRGADFGGVVISVIPEDLDNPSSIVQTNIR